MWKSSWKIILNERKKNQSINATPLEINKKKLKKNPNEIVADIVIIINANVIPKMDIVSLLFFKKALISFLFFSEIYFCINVLVINKILNMVITTNGKQLYTFMFILSQSGYMRDPDIYQKHFSKTTSLWVMLKCVPFISLLIVVSYCQQTTPNVLCL